MKGSFHLPSLPEALGRNSTTELYPRPSRTLNLREIRSIEAHFPPQLPARARSAPPSSPRVPQASPRPVASPAGRRPFSVTHRFSKHKTVPVYPEGKPQVSAPPPSAFRCSWTLPAPDPPGLAMAPLRFSANLSWLFPELPGLPERLRAAGSSGFEAAEVAWPYAEPPEALERAARDAGLHLVLINTPPGDQEKGEMGLGAVPGRQAAFREGLEKAVLYAKALGCPRIHLMAGRVPQGADPAAVRSEMETVFLENLRHAAEVLAQHPTWCQENLVGLLEPINTRITDPRYFLDTPQQAAAILQKVGRPNLQLQMDIFHWQIMDGNLTGNIREFLPIVGEGAPFLFLAGLLCFLVHPFSLHCPSGLNGSLVPCLPTSVPRACADSTGPGPRGARQSWGAVLPLPIPAAGR
ncbi:putative hydroxypyruvate isomerase isoform X4 [Heterocephalus glaber]|uniref:Hydroxypyruvate isomerase isoform X4 n=1 Tax=Heterocephalus glaber TaxID=10181 RepID=A0AAX6S6D2_HETGA|nr:putative hydroxypyruvate isomerase isoform X4 [Heterocephalus glaber]